MISPANTRGLLHSKTFTAPFLNINPLTNSRFCFCVLWKIKTNFQLVRMTCPPHALLPWATKERYLRYWELYQTLLCSIITAHNRFASIIYAISEKEHMEKLFAKYHQFSVLLLLVLHYGGQSEPMLPTTGVAELCRQPSGWTKKM